MGCTEGRGGLDLLRPELPPCLTRGLLGLPRGCCWSRGSGREGGADERGAEVLSFGAEPESHTAGALEDGREAEARGAYPGCQTGVGKSGGILLAVISAQEGGRDV